MTETGRPRNKTVVPLVRAAMMVPVLRAFAAQGGQVEALLSPHGLDPENLGTADTFVTNDIVYQV